MIFVLLFLIVVVAVLGLTIGVVAEYERAVVFRLGRVLGAKGPGPVVIVRGLDQVRRVSLQVAPIEISPREAITTDGATVRVHAVVYLKVVDPVRAVVDVEDYRVAAANVAQAVTRALLGEVSLDRLLHDQAGLGAQLTNLVAEQVGQWGVEVVRAELRDVEVLAPGRPATPPPAPTPSWADPLPSDDDPYL